jgi:hypothetical protein
VDLVDEEDVALLQVGQQAGEVARLLDDGAGGDADIAAELVAEDEGEGGLPEARRAGEEDVVVLGWPAKSAKESGRRAASTGETGAVRAVVRKSVPLAGFSGEGIIKPLILLTTNVH